MIKDFKAGDLVATDSGDLALITEVMNPNDLDLYGWLLFLPDKNKGIYKEEFSFVRLSNMKLTVESRPEKI